jgi:hypothetical protein
MKTALAALSVLAVLIGGAMADQVSYTEARAKALAWKSESPGRVKGLILEIGVADGALAIVLLAGHSAAAFSGDSGKSVGADNADMRRQIDSLLAMAEDHVGDAVAVTEMPRPEWGQTQFYFVTADGVRKIKASTESMAAENKAAPLFLQTSEMIGILETAP